MYRLYHRGGAVLGQYLSRLSRPLPKPFWLMVTDPTPQDEEGLAILGLALEGEPPEGWRSLRLPWLEGHLHFLLGPEELVTATPASFLRGTKEGWELSPSSTLDRLLKKALADLSPQVAQLREEEAQIVENLGGLKRGQAAAAFYPLRLRATHIRSQLDEWERQLAGAQLPPLPRLSQLRQEAVGCQEALRELSDWHLSVSLSPARNKPNKLAILTALAMLPTFLVTVAATNLSWPNGHLSTLSAFLITLGVFVIAGTASLFFGLAGDLHFPENNGPTSGQRPWSVPTGLGLFSPSSRPFRPKRRLECFAPSAHGPPSSHEIPSITPSPDGAVWPNPDP